MRTFLSLLFAAVLLVSLPTGGAAQVATDCTLYVAVTGTAGNNGLTPSTPKTLASASSASVAGSVICIMAGTYSMTGTFNPTRGGTAAAWITYKAYGDGVAKFVWTAGDAAPDLNMFHLFSSTQWASDNYLAVEGLEFDGNNDAAVGIKCARGHHIRLKNNTITNTGGLGISTKWCDYVHIEGNKISHVGYKQGTGSGISHNSAQWFDTVPGFHSYVLNNIISGTFDNFASGVDGNGIIMDLSDGTTTPGTADTPPVLIANNVVYQNGARCIHIYITSNIWVVHNTCYANTLDLSIAGTGELTCNNGKDSYFVNNIVSSWNGHHTFQQFGTCANIQYFANDGYGGSLNFTPAAPAQFFTYNPLFVSPPSMHATNDGQYNTAVLATAIGTALTLQPTSPAKDAGINPASIAGTPAAIIAGLNQYLASDITGATRPVGGFDLGAYELPAPPAGGGAPTRPGQPYAEAAKCAAPGVILCEDFDYPANFTCGADVGGGGQAYAWSNPGWAVVPTGSACAGKSLVAQTSVPAQPAGSPSGGYVKRVDPDNGEGQDVGCLWGDCNRNTDDSPSGQTYTNGAALSNDLYFRFQIYFSADYKWPDFDNKIFFMWPNRYVDKPSANIDAGMIFGNGVFCPTFNENFNDALSFRVGSNAGNFKIYPADANTDGYAEHPEYCLGDGYGNNSPAISRTDPPNDTPYPGTVFRLKKATWYTIEFRYKLGSEGVDNGIIEAWVNGTKVYSDSDLETCGDGLGNCAAVQEIVQYFWYNAFQEGGDLAGYGLFDNLIISTAYIGPPSAAAASTGTYWVAKTGNDSHTCLQAQNESTPKLTIASGATCLAPGETLRVKAGIYAEQLTDEIPGGTSWSVPVTVRADTGATVTIAPGVGQDGAVYFTSATSKYIVLDGINLDGTGETNGHGLIVNNNAHHIRMQNAEIKNFYNQGILSSGATSTGNEFLNLVVHDNGTRTDTAANLDHGIYLETDSNLIERCTVYNHTGHGIYLFSANAWQPDSNFIHRNTVYNNTTIGIGMYGGSGNIARNNIVYDSTNVGIKVSGTSANVTFNTIYSISEFGGYSETGSGHTWRNNIFADSGDWGLWLAAGVTGLTVQNNLFFNNTDGTIDNDAGATLTGTVTGDPLFVNAAGRNLHIQTGGAAVDAATSLSAITTDIDGESRPQGIAQDIGADEAMSSATPNAPSGLSGGALAMGGGSFQ